jgi:CRISPR-associated endonuclease/helicase Cas3
MTTGGAASGRPAEVAGDLFARAFHELTGNAPFGWQRRLYDDFVAHRPDMPRIPPAVDIPTGLGKTSIIHIWLLALAAQAEAGAVFLPRRLVYVVDRRTVVDQSTDVAVSIRERLLAKEPPELIREVKRRLGRLAADAEKPLAISTLRGEFADNKEWQADPARAAIIVGTVDMIGSRLLFSGYGVSRKMRPFHAGLLGQDALIVHDEAHLSPAFGKLIKGIEGIQTAANEPRPIRVVELSATRRGDEKRPEEPFALTEEEKSDPAVAKRLRAAKALTLDALDRPETLAETLVGAAISHATPPARVLIYVRSPDMARKVAALLPKDRVAILTGTIRGHERDQLAADPATIADETLRRRAEIFRGFRADRDRSQPLPASEYLVATSAGEVGIDLDADHMVSDLTTLDSMIQRLGRVNRLGEGDAKVDVVVAPREKRKGADDSSDDDGERIAATWAALQSLPVDEEGRHAASPAALRKMVVDLGAEGIGNCFSKEPLRPALTRALIDAWSMTSLKEHLGRPDVAPWLHGWVEDEQRTRLVWRRVLPVRIKDDAKKITAELEDYLEAAPVHVSEVLDTYTSTIAKLLQDRAKTMLKSKDADESEVEEEREVNGSEDEDSNAPLDPLRRPSIAAVVLASNGDVERVMRLGEITDAKPEALRSMIVGRTVIVDARIGGLDGTGHLDAKAKVVPTLDGGPSDSRGWTEESLRKIGYRATVARHESEPLAGWKVTYDRLIEIGDDEADDPSAALEWRVEEWVGDRAAENETAQAKEDQVIEIHHARAEHWMGEIARLVALPDEERPTFTAVAAVHDLGKARKNWQAYAGNPGFARYPQGLAKFKGRGNRHLLKIGKETYRHEFGSVRDARAHARMRDVPEGYLRDLALHLIATHHGNGRPLIAPVDERDPVSVPLARDIALRFARLQKRLGPWGLAWRESLLRSADVSASRELNASIPPSEVPGSERAPALGRPTGPNDGGTS